MPSEVDQTKRTFLQSMAAGAAALAFGKQVLGAASQSTASASVEKLTQVLRLDGPEWQIQLDSKNSGRNAKWYESVGSNAKPIAVPGVMQMVFPEYHGVAWFWRSFTAPANPHSDGRYWLRFDAVDYFAEVWVNGLLVGSHEGAQESFVLDVTQAMKPDANNLLAVRVINASHESIDGIRMEEVAVGRREYPRPVDNAYNTGGIVDSVELLITPVTRVNSLHVMPDWKSGDVRVVVELQNAGPVALEGHLRITVSPAHGGESTATVVLTPSLPVGVSQTEALLHVPDHRLWDVDDPYLYRVSAHVWRTGERSADECSTSCGFRDFRFENGYFRLNGRRIHLHGTLHTALNYPVTMSVPRSEGMLRRDLLLLKTLGYNSLRIHCGPALPSRQLEVADELGLLVCEEHFGARALAPSPSMGKRWDESVRQVIRRDRNHPSVVMWSLLNENPNDALFQNAVAAIRWIRDLDPTRLVLLNCGGFDRLNRLGELEGPHITPYFGFDCLGLEPVIQDGYSVVRWRCPQDATYTIEGTFSPYSYNKRDIPKRDTGSRVLLNGKTLHAGVLESMTGPLAQDIFKLRQPLKVGDELDFVQAQKGAFGASDLAVQIRSAAGDFFNLPANLFSGRNPDGPWHFGAYASGPVPLAATFKRFSETLGNTKTQGNMSNPGSQSWDTHLTDLHPYQEFPHTNAVTEGMRTLHPGGPVLISEFGVCGGQDYPRYLRHFEQWGQEGSADARLFQAQLDEFMSHWRRLRMDECWDRPEDYFAESQKYQAKLIQIDYNAWLGNPNVIGTFNSTQAMDAWYHGAGLTNYFRELKPGMADACVEMMAPVRWNLFIDRVNVYSGTTIRLQAVLFNLDVVPPGQYPVKLQAVGPGGARVFEKRVMIDIPKRDTTPEPPFAQLLFNEEIKIDGPSGKYRFLAAFERGAAACGGEAEFYVGNRVEMPAVAHEIILWGDDPELMTWLTQAGLRVKPGLTHQQMHRELILASGKVPVDRTRALAELTRRIAKGSAVVFLQPQMLLESPDYQSKSFIEWVSSEGQRLPMPGAPLGSSKRPTLYVVKNWWFRMDQWAKSHPIFNGLLAGGLMDQTFYQDLLPDQLLDIEAADECVSGAVQTSVAQWLGSSFPAPDAALMVSVHHHEAGRFILNTLRIRENLGEVPAAERLLRNMLNYVAKDIKQPLAS